MADEFINLWATFLLHLEVDLGRATVKLYPFSCVKGKLSIWRIDFLDTRQFGLFYENSWPYDRTELSEFYRKSTEGLHQFNVAMWSGGSEISLICEDFRYGLIGEFDCSKEYQEIRREYCQDETDFGEGEMISGEAGLIAGDRVARRHFPFAMESHRRRGRWERRANVLPQAIDSIEIDVDAHRVALEKRTANQTFSGWEEEVAAVGVAWGTEASWSSFFLGEVYDQIFPPENDVRTKTSAANILLNRRSEREPPE